MAPEKTPRTKIPSSLRRLIEAIAENTTIMKKTGRKRLWNQVEHKGPPKWIPKTSLAARLFRRSPLKTPMEKFDAQFEQLVWDMRYFVELARHRDVKARCGFQTSFDSIAYAEWALMNIFLLEDDGSFPPARAMCHVARSKLPGRIESDFSVFMRKPLVEKPMVEEKEEEIAPWTGEPFYKKEQFYK